MPGKLTLFKLLAVWAVRQYYCCATAHGTETPLHLPCHASLQEEASALKAAEQRAKHLSRELQEAQASAAAHAKSAAELETRWAEAEKALGAVLKAANSGLKAVAAGKEEAKSLGEALRSCVGGVENAPAAPAVSSGRSRQSSGRQWR